MPISSLKARFTAALGTDLPRRRLAALLPTALLPTGLLAAPAAGKRRAKRTCKKSKKLCGKKCVNLKTDPKNCGGCGTRCPTGQRCDQGICRLPVFTNTLTWDGTGSGHASEGFMNTTAIAINADGHFFVADRDCSIVQQFDRNRTFVRMLGTGGAGTGAEQLNIPTGLAFGPDKLLYIADSGNSRVIVWRPDKPNVPIGLLFPPDDVPTFEQPVAVDVDPDGNLYIVDTSVPGIYKFSKQGTLAAHQVGFGDADDRFNAPRGIAVIPGVGVYVTDPGNARVKRYTLDLELVTTWRDPGFEPGQLIYPTAIAASPDGLLCISDLIRRDVQIFSRDGVFLDVVPNPDGDQFGQPLGIAFNKRKLYIGDGNYRNVYGYDIS